MAGDRILVIRLTALGDVVLVEPVARAIQSALGGVAVDLVTEARYARALEGRSSFDRVFGFDRHGQHAGWSGLSRFISALPTQHYRAIVDLQGKLRTRVLARRIGASARVTLKKRSFTAALGSVLGKDPPLTDRHTVDLYLSCLSSLGIDLTGIDRRPRLSPRRQPRSGALRIGLGIGAAHATKRWPIERFAELCRRLSAERSELCFVPITGPSDKELADALREQLPAGWLDPTDTAALDVAGLAELISGLDLLVGVDSGPSHLAAALGVPVVSLFGPTSPRRWAPIGEEHRVVSLGLPCAPCSNVGSAECPLPSRSHECMRGLGVELAVTAALDVLDSAGRRP